MTKDELIIVKDPTSIAPGSIDIDEQLYKLAHNLRALAHLKFTAGTVVAQAEYQIASKSAAMAINITDDEMQGVVKSDKFKLIKYRLAELYRDAELARIKYRYLCDMWSTYHEWINIYKKSRVSDGGQP